MALSNSARASSFSGNWPLTVTQSRLAESTICSWPGGGSASAIASPAYLAQHGRPITPQDLLDHQCISWRWPGHRSAYKWEFHDDGRTFEVAVEGSLFVDSTPAAIRAAAEGIGIAFAAEQAVAAYAPPESVEKLLEGWTAPFPASISATRATGTLRQPFVF